jgi:uncharacterized protein (TIGR03118 family)
MDFLAFFRKKRTGPARQRWYRPTLECLEDRQLLSGGFGLVNLASDVPGLARVTDLNLVNPWGMAYSPTGPFWFADNGSGVSDILDGRGGPFSLVVTVPSAARSGSAPTGIVFNNGAGFMISKNGVSAPSRFLFTSEDGTISGWTTVVDPTRALVAVDNSSSGADYTGLTLAADPTGHSFLYTANFSRGTIDVFDQYFRPAVRLGAFQDPNLPDGYAPFNILNINDLLFVTYARQQRDGDEGVAGAGHGFIDVYDTGGSLIRRFASEGALDSPWGLALAPSDFGPFGGALLVGNHGDGHINAYDAGSGTFLGQLASYDGMSIAIPNLWALTFGNGHEGGDSDTLFFATGLEGNAHGLFGAIQSPERRGADTAGAGTFDPNAPGEPADYPLPPRDGPAFRAGSEQQPILIADLLPLRESSLVLVPTLSTNSQPTTGIDASVLAAPTVVAASGGSAFASAGAPNTIVLLSADGNSQPARGDYIGTVTLDSLFDVNASQNSPQQAGVQGPGTSLNVAAAPSSPSAERDIEGWGLPPETYVENVDLQSGEEQSPAALPPAGQAGEVLTAVPSKGSAESEDEREVRHEHVKTRGGGDWTNLANALVIVSIPMIWTYWVSHKMWSRQSSHGNSECRKARAQPQWCPRP